MDCTIDEWAYAEANLELLENAGITPSQLNEMVNNIYDFVYSPDAIRDRRESGYILDENLFIEYIARQLGIEPSLQPTDFTIPNQIFNVMLNQNIVEFNCDGELVGINKLEA